MTTTADTLDAQETHVIESGTDDAELHVDPADTANGEQSDDVSIVDGEPGEGEDSELTLQFGDEAPPASDDSELVSAPQWVKELRKSDREKARKIRELEATLKTQQQPAQVTQVPTLGAKPKLEEFDYDEVKFDSALEQWYETKRKVDAVKAESEARERARQEAAQAKHAGYQKEAKALGVKDYQDAESEVVAELSVEQQGILLAGADKPALLVYALGRNPAKLKTLAAITDPVRFAFAAAKLEKELKVTSRNAPKPAPEARISSSGGGAPASGGSQKTLDRLREKAEKTGDYSEVIRYKRQLKEAQKR